MPQLVDPRLNDSRREEKGWETGRKDLAQPDGMHTHEVKRRWLWWRG